MKPLPLNYWSELRAKSLAKSPIKRGVLVRKRCDKNVVSAKVVKKRDSLPDLIKRAVTVFHKWIKQRDGGDGIYVCISCGKLGDSKEAHASHYLNAGNNSAVRFHENNVNLSCQKCNLLLHGNTEQYRIRLIGKIGLCMVEELEALSKVNWKWDRSELEGIIERYRVLTSNP